MTTQQKIEKKGYKVTFNMGYKNNEQTIVSVSAEKNGQKITAPNITQLLKRL
jgi:hypothetical protein